MTGYMLGHMGIAIYQNGQKSQNYYFENEVFILFETTESHQMATIVTNLIFA